MRNSFFIIGIIFLMVALQSLSSCREDSDTVLSYANNGGEDGTSFDEARKSLTGQFDAFWTAMNCNYQIWDYEAQFGINWDNVYDKYHHRFLELDKIYSKENPIPDDSLKTIYREIVNPLHDGHFVLHLENIHTQKRLSNIRPSENRNFWEEERISFHERFIFSPDYSYYCSDHLGENRIVEDIEDDDYEYCRFADNILCLRLTGIINWPAYEKPWEKWYNTIQELYNNNSLKGIIIDLRNCDGGASNNYQYILGALQSSDKGAKGPHRIGWIRTKNGIGRLDYSPLVPFSCDVYPNEHAIISKEPVVILANCRTGSFAEVLCYEATKMPNGCVIGKRTWGGLGPLYPDNSLLYYSYTYSGMVGNANTPFELYNPCAAFILDNGEIIEGKGVEPTIDISLDEDLFDNTSRDNQLERALEYIRTGK